MMKLRTITREELYLIEESLFHNVYYLSRERTPKEILALAKRLCPDVVLHFTWNEEWDGFEDERPWEESCTWRDYVYEGDTFGEKSVINVFISEDERTYHCLIHELAHVLQGWGDDDEEHSPEWLLYYAWLLKKVRKPKAAAKLLEALV